jgi:Flp pilus assembly protein TadG
MKILKTERGQSLVELSISLLVLLYLLSGAVEFGLAFFQFVQLRDAAQEGALYGSMNTSVDIESRVRGASSSPINLSDTGNVIVTITAKDVETNSTIPVSGACEGDALQVEVSYPHAVFMPFMSQLIGPTITLHATVTDTVLAPPPTDAKCS